MKKSFTLIELTIVISVILILSTIIVVGMGRANQEEGLKADYLEFYDNLKNLQLRANLGKIVNPGESSNLQTSVQKIVFYINTSNYSINNEAQKSLKNQSKFRLQSVYPNGTAVTLYLYPSSFTGPTPTGGFIYQNNNSLGDNVNIYIVKTDYGIYGYPIVLSGATYKLATINAGGRIIIATPPPPTNTPLPLPTAAMRASPTVYASPTATKTPTPTPDCSSCSAWTNRECDFNQVLCSSGADQTILMYQERRCTIDGCRTSQCVIDKSCDVLTPTPTLPCTCSEWVDEGCDIDYEFCPDDVSENTYMYQIRKCEEEGCAISQCVVNDKCSEQFQQ